MLANAFIGNAAQPTDAALTEVLGPARRLWDQLLEILKSEFELTIQEWNSYSRKSGWALRIKRKERNIVYLSPHLGCFTVSYALGDAAVQAALAGKLPPAIVRTIQEAKRYAEGTAVRVEVHQSKDLAAVRVLTAAKLAN